MNWFLLLLALLAGAALPPQAALNAAMGRQLGHPVWAALFSFAAGTVGLLLFALAARLPTGQLEGWRTAAWWLWLPGLLGAFYISTTIALVPRLGLTLTFGLVIAGQLLVSLLFDQFGWLGTAVQPVSPGRLVGALLLLAGVWLIRRN